VSNRFSAFLVRALLADAIVSAVVAALMIAGAAWLAEWLRLPASLLRVAGFVLVPYVAVVLYASKRPSRTSVLAIIGCNVAWAAACVLLLASGWITPNAFGVAFVLAQAITVVVFAELQYVGLRRPVAAA
jgi:hypothetical protein